MGLGKNSDGELGDSSRNDQLSPVYIRAFSGMIGVAPGLLHTTAHAERNISCPSNIITIDVNELPLVEITYNEPLFTTNSGGSSYQWFFNGNPIPGATGQTHEPSAEGRYSVRIQFPNGCENTSEEFNYPPVGVEDIMGQQLAVTLYPNPGKGMFYIDLNQHSASNLPMSIDVYDLIGKQLVHQEMLIRSGKTTVSLDLSLQEKGMYVLLLKFSDQVLHREIILQ